jgi:outer membrane receptor for ferrienterochelin and colicins
MKTVLLGSVAALVAAASASAQSIDYATMQDMFGEPVTLGATGAPQRASDAPATMIVITREEIERHPAIDIPDILGRFAGVDTERYTRGQGEVSIRGYNTPYNPRLLVLINGRQVYLDHYGYVNWSALPVQLDEIQQIEVVKGPQAALYGFNAVSGVVNIITRDPTLGDWSTVSVSAGTGEYRELSATFGRQLGERFALRGSLGINQADEFNETPLFQVPDYASFESLEAALELRGALNEDFDFSLEATYANNERNELAGMYYFSDGYTELSSFKAELVGDLDVGVLTTRAYRNNADVDMLYPATNRVTVGQAELLSQLSTRDTTRVAVEYRYNEMDSTGSDDWGRVYYHAMSASAMWTRKLTDTLSATGAVRYDRLDAGRDASPDPSLFIFGQDDYDQEVSDFGYNFALVWHLTGNQTLRASTARGLQVPSLIDVGQTNDLGVGLGAITGNPYLDPTVMTAYELAYSARLGIGRLEFALFRTEMEDYKAHPSLILPSVLPPAAPVPQLVYQNFGNSDLTGAEISLADSNEADAWRWRVAATVYEVEDDLTVNQDFDFYPIDFEATTPSYRLKGDFGWSGDRVDLDVFASYAGEFDNPVLAFPFFDFQEIDTRFEVSARGRYHLTDSLQVSVNAAQANFGDGEQAYAGEPTEARVWVSLRAQR